MPAAQLPALTIDDTSTGGTHVGSSATVPAAAFVSLTEDLTIVALHDLVVAGWITVQPPDRRLAVLLQKAQQALSQLSSAAAPSPVLQLLLKQIRALLTPRPINITLVSVDGTVTIEDDAHVSAGSAPAPNDAVVASLSPVATGDRGQDGGYVKISGVNVNILGTVHAQDGAAGGNATADAAGAPFLTSSGFLQGLFKFLGLGGDANATGGIGGAGGDVLICAQESLNVSGGLLGGRGGLGGAARAIADHGEAARATAGQSGEGGDVQITGTGGSPVQVYVSGTIRGGEGGGFTALLDRSTEAVGGSGLEDGGPAEASGSPAGAGGTVLFSNAVVMQSGRFRAGDGGNGGDATANGGNGAGIRFSGMGTAVTGDGYPGGAAKATGGRGAAHGLVPRIPVLPIGTFRDGLPGTNGSGGDATATGGRGSDGVLNRLGGAAGSAEALGGANGAGTSPAPPAVSAPAASTTNTAPMPVPASQPGTP
jgi:hypothetical protein